MSRMIPAFQVCVLMMVVGAASACSSYNFEEDFIITFNRTFSSLEPQMALQSDVKLLTVKVGKLEKAVVAQREWQLESYGKILEVVATIQAGLLDMRREMRGEFQEVKARITKLESGVADMKSQVDKSFLLQTKMVKAVEIFIGLMGTSTTERLQILTNAAGAVVGHFRGYFGL